MNPKQRCDLFLLSRADVPPFVRWHRGSDIANACLSPINFKLLLGVGMHETGKGDFPLGLK
jgi:hypothetical protein